jgi:hypothetical protein
MFKVHLPATSYLRKQVPFFGTNHFLDVMRGTPLLKSAGLLYLRGPNGHPVPHPPWAPESAVNPDPNVPDHPPWNHHPETGELLPGGMHPMDYMLGRLQDIFGYTPERALEMANGAIDDYNAVHDDTHGKDQSNHYLPPADSPQWRKVHVGPYHKKDLPVHARQSRSQRIDEATGKRHLITYSMNQGNVAGGQTGNWIDGGLVYIGKQLADRLIADGKNPQEVNSEYWAQHSALKPGTLSGDLVASVGPRDYRTYERTGTLPPYYLSEELKQARADQRSHPEVSAVQLLQLLPDQFYHPTTARVGGRKGKDGLGLVERISNKLRSMGVADDMSDEELQKLASTRAMRMLFQSGGHRVGVPSGDGATKKLTQQLLQHLGSDHNEESFGIHAEHAGEYMEDAETEFGRKANKHAADIVAHMSHVAAKLMDQGMPEDEAKAEVVRRVREADISAGTRFGPHEDHDAFRERAESIIESMLGRTNRKPFSLGSIPTQGIQSHGRIAFGDSKSPEHWSPRMHYGNEMEPIGRKEPSRPLPEPAPERQVGVRRPLSEVRDDFLNRRGVPAPPELPTAQALPPAAPVPQPRVAPAPQIAPYPMRPATALEEQYQQFRGTPREQTFFDIGTGSLVQRSNDVASDLDLLRKKMGYFDGFLRGEW